MFAYILSIDQIYRSIYLPLFMEEENFRSYVNFYGSLCRFEERFVINVI